VKGPTVRTLKISELNESHWSRCGSEAHTSCDFILPLRNKHRFRTEVLRRSRRAAEFIEFLTGLLVYVGRSLTIAAPTGIPRLNLTNKEIPWTMAGRQV
jgi:hypothetical protein